MIAYRTTHPDTYINVFFGQRIKGETRAASEIASPKSN